MRTSSTIALALSVTGSASALPQIIQPESQQFSLAYAIGTSEGTTNANWHPIKVVSNDTNGNVLLIGNREPDARGTPAYFLKSPDGGKWDALNFDLSAGQNGVAPGVYSAEAPLAIDFGAFYIQAHKDEPAYQWGTEVKEAGQGGSESDSVYLTHATLPGYPQYDDLEFFGKHIFIHSEGF